MSSKNTVYVEIHSFFQNAPSLFFEFASREAANAAIQAGDCVGPDARMARDVRTQVRAHVLTATQARAAGRNNENTVVTFDKLPDDTDALKEARESML